MTKLLHNGFYFIFTIYINTILFVEFVNSYCKYNKSRWFIFTSLIKETDFKWWRFFKKFSSKPFLINSCKWVSIVNSGFHVSFTHFYLYCKKQSCTLWVKSKMITTIKFPKLRNLIINSIYSAHHISSRIRC